MKFNNPFSKAYVFLFFPLILVMVLDLVFTLIGQSQDYWRNFQFFNEANPMAGFLLSHHPALFVLFFCIYLILVLFLVVNLKKPFNLIFYIFFFLIHSWGSSSWLSELFFSFQADYLSNWCLNIGYFIFISLVSGFSLSLWLKNRNI
ncbi:MAG: hypothetical protein NTZ84_00720 [Candidatus Nealsonbacteria bacterium]|nr:hypothetical protein [Candidatus Nealsonbacteria bacterium]